VIPCIEITGVQHARRTSRTATIPKIVFGKNFESNDRSQMPVSVDVNHDMMDGYHVGKYFELFQKELGQIA